MTCTPSPRPPRSEWLTNSMLRDATAFMSRSPRPLSARRFQPAAEKQLPDARIGENFFGAVRDPHAAELEHDAVVGILQRTLGVLLDHQHADAASTQLLEQREQLLHQDRRQPDRGLVDEHQFRLE